MFNLIVSLLKYFSAWLVMSMTVVLALSAESLSSYFSSRILEDNPKPVSYINRSLLASFRRKTVLPEGSCSWLLIYGPAFSLAALFPICAAVPFFSFIPLMENGADMLQIIQFFLLSDVIVVVTLFGMLTDASSKMAFRVIKESTSLLLLMFMLFIMLAGLVSAGGAPVDDFRLGSFLASESQNNISWLSYVGIFIFIFIIFSKTPCSFGTSSLFMLHDEEIAEYQGFSRALLQLSLVFRSFITTALIVSVFFPAGGLGIVFKSLSFSWQYQFWGFVSFWLAVIFVRVVFVPLFQFIANKIKRLLPNFFSFIFIPALALAACAMIYRDAVRIAMEMASY